MVLSGLIGVWDIWTHGSLFVAAVALPAAVGFGIASFYVPRISRREFARAHLPPSNRLPSPRILITSQWPPYQFARAFVGVTLLLRFALVPTASLWVDCLLGAMSAAVVVLMVAVLTKPSIH